jgi:hypothetical protein
MKRLRIEQRVSLERLERSAIDIDKIIKREISEKIANFILENFIAELDDYKRECKVYTIDLLVGDYSKNDEIIKRLNDLYRRVPENLVAEVYNMIAIFKGMDINENFKHNRK